MLDKEIYSIEEVGRIVGVQPHVLRYWESEFPQVTPERNEQGQRAYSRTDIDTLLPFENCCTKGSIR
jgi:DNA-binding transcriptional MerR regulator